LDVRSKEFARVW